MGRISCYLLSLIILISILPMNTYAVSRPGVSARGAVLIEQQSGRVLFGYNHRERLGPASTTKIMTAIVAFEHGNFDDVVTNRDRNQIIKTNDGMGLHERVRRIMCGLNNTALIKTVLQSIEQNI